MDDATAPGSGVLVRTRLLDRLLGLEARPLTVIHAGPGYGKTTLIDQYLAAATLSARVDPFGLTDARSVTGRLDRLVADLRPGRADGEPLHLALDDVDALGDPAIPLAVLDWTERQRRVRVVLATGRRPAVPLGRMRANRSVLALGSADLAYTAAELRDVLARRRLEDLPDEVLTAVLARSQGWPAAISLATATTSADGHGADLLTAMDGAGWDFVEYFADAVDRAGVPDPAGLGELAVLETLSVETCRALPDGQRRWQTLLTMARHEFFCAPDGGRGHRLRLHPLFRQYLLHLLEGEGPAVVRDVHGRAADALVASGEPARAIGHYMRAEQPDQAARLLSSVGFGAVDHVGGSGLDVWTLVLSTSQVHDYPWLSALEGRLRRLQLDFDGALVALSQARARFAAIGDADGLAWVTSEIQQVGYADQAYAASIRATERTLTDRRLSPEARASLEIHLCWMRCEAGPVLGADGAVGAGERALAAIRDIEDAGVRRSLHVRASRNLALARLLGGDPHSALVLLSGRTGTPGAGQDGWSAVVQAGALHLTGDDVAAWQLLDAVLTVADAPNSIQRQRAHLWRGHLLRARGDLDGALASYARAGRAAAVDRLVTRVLSSGRGTGDERISDEEEGLRELEASDLVVDRGGAALIRALMLLGERPEEAVSACSAAEEVFTEAGFAHHAWSARAVRAEALDRAGDPAAAGALRAAIHTWQVRSGLVRLHWQTPHAITPSAAPSRGAAAPETVDRSSVLVGCSDPAIRRRVERALTSGVTERSVAALVEAYGLTWREVDVFLAYFLRAVEDLPGGSTFRDRCARRLGITEHTLKTHITRVRRKLGLSADATPDTLRAWLRGIPG